MFITGLNPDSEKDCVDRRITEFISTGKHTFEGKSKFVSELK